MIYNKFKFVVVFILLLIPCKVVFSQIQKSGSSLYPTLNSNREQLYTELRALPHKSSDSMLILVLFRIQYDALIFEKNNTFRGELVAMPTLEIEIKDTNGVIRGRVQWKDSVFAQTYEQSNDEAVYAYGMRSLIMLNNQYVATLSLSDKGRIIKKVRLPEISRRDIEQPYFSSGNPFSDAFTPDIYNGNIPFISSKQCAIIPIASTITISSASLLRLRANEEYAGHVKLMSSTKTELRQQVIITPEHIEESAAIQPFPLIISEFSGYNLLIIQFPDNVIAPGRYALILHRTDKKAVKDSIRFDFNCQWEDMPKTLISAEYARQVMKYLLTDDEFDAMSGGTDAEILKRIIHWWKKNDPTPTTIYDEPMTEYFRRADRAFTEFQTISESDGIMTQRGKIALLYGFPKQRDTEISTQGVKKEIWKYPAPINKRFIFTQQSGKNFALTAIEDL